MKIVFLDQKLTFFKNSYSTIYKNFKFGFLNESRDILRGAKARKTILTPHFRAVIPYKHLNFSKNSKNLFPQTILDK